MNNDRIRDRSPQVLNNRPAFRVDSKSYIGSFQIQLLIQFSLQIYKI